MALHITPDNKLRKLVIIGDRVLIRPSTPSQRTESGLFLPPGVQEKERAQHGWIRGTGRGCAIPLAGEEEPRKSGEAKIEYLPLQGREGDLAICLLNGATEIMYQNEKYFIVPQNAILMLERDEEI